MSSKVAPKAYFPHIDGLRTFAVLGVLLEHFHIPGFPGGFLGVDVFFVISGFLITRLIIQERSRTGTFSYGRFYVRRIRRLMPAALVVIVFSIVAFYPILGANDLVSFLRSVPFAIFSISNINFYKVVGYFDNAAQFKPLLHTWSLAVEEQFYLIWPTLLLILLRAGRYLLPATITLMLFSVAGAEIIRPIDFSAAYYLLPFRAFELLIGAILATITSDHSSNYRDIYCLSTRTMTALAGIGLTLILSSYFILSERSPLPGPLSLLVCLGTALVIAYGAHGPVSRILTWQPMVWVGLISYSLYLVHWPVFVYISYRLPDMPSLPLRLAMFPISIVLAAASYYLIEQRFRHPVRKNTRWGNSPFVAAALLMAVLTCVPTGIYAAFPEWRLPSRMPFGPPSMTHVVEKRVPYPRSPTGASMLTYRSSAKNAPKVLILGDSHAGHLRGAAEHYLAPQGIDVDLASLTGCPGLMAVTIRYETLSDTCTRNIEARKALALDPTYDVVILSTRWNAFLSPPQIGGINFPLARLEMPSADNKAPPSSLESSREIFLTSLSETIDAIIASEKKLIIIAQVPPLWNDLAQCQSLFPWVRVNTGRCFRLPIESIIEQSEFADTALQKATDGREGIMLISPRDYMCDTLRCDLTDPETRDYLYRDSNHLDSAGAVWLIMKADQDLGLIEFIRSAKRF